MRDSESPPASPWRCICTSAGRYRPARPSGSSPRWHVDDLPWLWADASDHNTIDIGALPPGEHKVKIELVDPTHRVFPGQVVTLTFTVPEYDREAVYGPGH